MQERLKKLLFCRNGATTVEYAVIAILLFLVIIIGVSSTGSESNKIYSSTAEKTHSAFNP